MNHIEPTLGMPLPTLATHILAPHSKVLAVAMFAAFGTLVANVHNRWLARGPDHESALRRPRLTRSPP
jgi:hypothetical protein